MVANGPRRSVIPVAKVKEEDAVALKNLLVHADQGRAAAATLAVAASLASRHAAHLSAVHVIPAHALPAYVESELPVEVVQARERRALDNAAAVRTAVEAAARAAGIAADWIAVRGDAADAVLPFARRVDMTIVGQSGDDTPADRLARGLPERLLLGSGRPVLVVPRYGRFEQVGERVLVAWSGTREAARAVNDALPVLAGAKEVTLLAINPAGAGDVPTGDIALHLARHGIAATAAQTQGDSLAIGDVLLSRAADLAADLIVMGGYGHSRVRELALGGATRHILAHMTVPVLMSH